MSILLSYMTVWLAVHCPDCHFTDVSKHSSFAEGKKRYSCNNSECLRHTFILDNSRPGRRRSIKNVNEENDLLFQDRGDARASNWAIH